jgi:hypothetical protein
LRKDRNILERSEYAMKTLFASCVALTWPLALSFGAEAQTPVPAPKPAGPQVTIVVGPRHGHVTPVRHGCCTHTGGGNVDIVQPTPDTVIVTMTGVCVATGHPCKNAVASMEFDLEQCFEVIFESPEVKKAKLTIEGRVIGLLRSYCKGGGSAQEGPAHAAVTCCDTEIVSLSLPEHSVCGGENLSINDHEGPITVPVGPGKHMLLEKISISANHPHSVKLCKAASAEFAPDPALDPLWISYWEPFHGANKKDFGFQITIKVAPE